MLTDVLNALGAERYMQHSLCLTNDPIMMFLYTGADFVTFFAYVVIGLAVLFARRRMLELMFNFQVLFGAFIFLCGLSHLTMVLTLYEGIYRLDVFVRVAMATVSLVTVAFVMRDLLFEPAR